MASKAALAARIRRLEEKRAHDYHRFQGLLEYDCSTETRTAAAKRAPRPGLYLVLESFDPCTRVQLEVLVSGGHRFMEDECAST